MFSISDLKVNKKILIVFLMSTICLSLIHYLGNVEFFLGILKKVGMISFKKYLEHLFYGKEQGSLYALIFWILIIDIFYLIVPALLVTLVFKEKLSDYGLSFKLERGWWKIYVVFMLVMFPLVFFFSGTDSFQSKYPFYHFSKQQSLWPNFFIWELFYFSQFFCLEFFFRGFMVHGLKKDLGQYSILVMVIPYCMIHFGKPLPETLSAIVAGLALGYLSYKNKSILLGFFLHITVALSMDLLSLWRKDYFNFLIYLK